MIRLARLSIRRPVLSLLLIGASCLALSLIGLGVASSLSPSLTTVPGTQASRAQHLADAHFGPSVLVPILLEGPQAQLDRQGPALVRALSRRSDTRVLSAWDAGSAGASLRPRPGAAVIVASVARTEKQMVKTYEAQIEKTVHKQVSGPVRASITGQPSIDRAMRDRAIDLARARMALAIPIIFLVLLLLLRAPVAAFALTALGAGTGYSAAGLTALLAKGMDVDALTLVLGMTTGFALASGYGLMYYRRWRAEMAADGSDHDAAHAATAALGGVGRALLIGGTALLAARASAALFGPTKVLSSLYITAVLASALAIGAAVVVMPAALVLLGRRAQWLSFGVPGGLVRAWDRLVSGGGWAVRHSAATGLLVGAALVALAIPLLSMHTGPPSAKFLPKGDPARVAYERVAQVMGPGWPTPYNIVVYSPNRPITDRALLAKIGGFQSDLARDPRIASVVGPGEFTSVSRQLGALPTGLKQSSKLLKGGQKDLGRLEAGLGQAGAGVKKLRAGLQDAANGANQLHGGSGQAQSGSGQLRSGLDQARNGAAQISAGLAAALTGARKLRDGAASALSGSRKITGGLGQAVAPVKSGAPIVKSMAADVGASRDAVKGAQGSAQALATQLDQAAAAVAAMPSSADKSAAAGAIASARQAAGGLVSSLTSTSAKLSGAAGIADAFSGQVAQLATGLSQLYAGSTALTGGIAQLQKGNSDLASGIGQLAGGGGTLTNGLTALRNGAAQLENGLGQLTSGSGQLAGGLAAGAGPTGTLVSGLGQMESGVAKFRGSLPSTKDIERLMKESPGLFDSGYFVLAAIQGAQPGPRNQASFAVNLSGGGNAGQITVISRYAAETPAAQQLGKDLSAKVDAFAHRTGTQVALGGPAGSLGDFLSEGKSSILPVVIGVTAVVLLLLMVMLGAIVAPVVAVVLDLLGVGAAFGIMSLLFSGHDPLLGGLGYIDPVSIIAGFTAAFGALVFFQSQLLIEARGEFMRTGDAEGAVRHGLRSVAAGTTGVAVVWIATIIPSALSNVITIRQVAVADGLGILLATLLVRPLLLPVTMKLIGHRAWWPAHRAPRPPVEPSTSGQGTLPRPVMGGRA